MVNGFADRTFTCPVFGTRHQIPRDPTHANGTSLFFIYYRGMVYFLEPYYNTDEQQFFFTFGLVENLGLVTTFRHILEISEDTRLRYPYDTSGMRAGQEKIEK